MTETAYSTPLSVSRLTASAWVTLPLQCRIWQSVSASSALGSRGGTATAKARGTSGRSWLALAIERVEKLERNSRSQFFGHRSFRGDRHLGRLDVVAGRRFQFELKADIELQDRLDQLFQRRDPRAGEPGMEIGARIERPRRLEGDPRYMARTVRSALQRMVVDDNRFQVGGELDVDLQPFRAEARGLAKVRGRRPSCI
jgi:hypothetical protein